MAMAALRPIDSLLVKSSSDTGSPTIHGNAGSLQTTLRELLVNGCTNHNVTSITRSGSTITVVMASSVLDTAGYRFQSGAYILIAGANETDYNGVIGPLLTSNGTNTWTADIGGLTPASPATGTITARVASCGWTEPYNDGASVSAFRMQTTGGATGFYLWVNDNYAGTNTTTAAAIRGYETMSAHTTGTGLFPTVAQRTDGLFCKKSSATGTTARDWWFAGDGKGFYLWVRVDGASTDASYDMSMAFGDIGSIVASDAYHCYIGGRTSNNSTATSFIPTSTQPFADYSATLTNAGYVARQNDQTGTSSVAIVFGIDPRTNSPMGAHARGTMSPVAGYDSTLGIITCPITVLSNRKFRGYLRGIYDMHINASTTADGALLANGLQFNPATVGPFGTTPPGEVLQLQYVQNSSARGAVACDVIGPWF